MVTKKNHKMAAYCTKSVAMNKAINKFLIQSAKLNNFLSVPSLLPTIFAAGYRDLRKVPPPNYSHVQIPEKNKLKFMEKVPTTHAIIKPAKCTKRLIDIRGPEPIHTDLIHQQYGVIALTGGNLLSGHIEMIRMVINRKMDPRRMFAVWRIDAPWKPVTKKSQGKRMGGGKAAIHHYVTPVKAGRVIFEMGGKVEYDMVRPLLIEVVQKMPFKSMAVSKEILDEMKAEEKRKEEENINPYSFKYVVDNGMLGCHQWVGPYDFMWYAKYR